MWSAAWYEHANCQSFTQFVRFWERNEVWQEIKKKQCPPPLHRRRIPYRQSLFFCRCKSIFLTGMIRYTKGSKFRVFDDEEKTCFQKITSSATLRRVVSTRVLATEATSTSETSANFTISHGSSSAVWNVPNYDEVLVLNAIINARAAWHLFVRPVRQVTLRWCHHHNRLARRREPGLQRQVIHPSSAKCHSPTCFCAQNTPLICSCMRREVIILTFEPQWMRVEHKVEKSWERERQCPFVFLVKVHWTVGRLLEVEQLEKLSRHLSTVGIFIF